MICRSKQSNQVYACLAQSVEHAAVNRSVGGPSPSTGAIKHSKRSAFCLLNGLDSQHLRCTALPLTLLFAVDAHKFANSRWSSPQQAPSKPLQTKRFFVFYTCMLSANMSRICPPSSRVSPFCHTAEPFGQGNTRLSHIKRRRLIMSLVALVQKNHSAPATSYFRLVLGAPFLVAAAPRVPSSKK